MNNTISFLTRVLTSSMLTMLLLIACSPDNAQPQAIADFSLSVSGNLSAVQGTEVQTNISITRNNGFSDAVTLGVNDLPASVTQTFTPNPSGGDTATLNLTVANSVVPGDYPLTLAGNAGGIEKTTSLVLTVTPASPSPTPTSPIINAVTIQDNDGSSQVRQSAGAITLDVTGENLNGINSATLGAVNGTIVTNTDSAASLTFTIPSGADLGSQTLGLTTGLGVAEKEEAVIISKITVSNTGDDTTGRGTPDKPFKTMNFAVSQAGSGDIVRLLDGTYNEASGEVFPFTFPSGVRLRLEGESETGTIIQGTGSSSLDCLEITDSEVTLSTLTVKNCDDGVLALDTAVVTIRNTTLTENGNGLSVNDTTQVKMENSTVENSEFSGVSVRGDSSLEIRGGSVSNNGLAGFISGVSTLQTAAGVLRLEGVTVERNTSGGLRLDSQGTVEVFDCVITNNGRDGVSLIEVGPVNLGDATRAGNNTITDNGDFQLSDERPASSVDITAHGNTVGNSVTTGIQTGADSDANNWNILTAGNQIDFGP